MRKIILFVFIIFVTSIFYVLHSERTDVSEFSDQRNSTCACAKSVEKLLEAQEANILVPGSISKEYRVKKEALITDKILEEALQCTCASKLQARALNRKIISETPVDLDLAVASDDVIILTPAIASRGCKTIMEMEYKFSRPMNFKQAQNLFRNYAAGVGANAILLTSYEQSIGASAKILQCRRDKLKLEQKLFTNSEFKYVDGNVFDPITGLTWQQCSRGQTQVKEACVNDAKVSTFSSAKKYCLALKPIKRRRWRLPEVEELHTLVQKENGIDAKIDATFFPTTPAEVFWTQTPYWDKKAVMAVDFDSGNKIAYNKELNGYTRCVINVISDVTNPE